MYCDHTFTSMQCLLQWKMQEILLRSNLCLLGRKQVILGCLQEVYIIITLLNHHEIKFSKTITHEGSTYFYCFFVLRC